MTVSLSFPRNPERRVIRLGRNEITAGKGRIEMPHFGLMSTEDSFRKPEGALLRARLHIRGGKRRLTQGKISAGIVTLYDALIFGLRWYLTAPEHREELRIHEAPDLTDEKAMIRALESSGVLDSSFDLRAFDELVEKAAYEEMPGFDYGPVLAQFESLMRRLEVMPFDEEALPPEDPATF